MAKFMRKSTSDAKMGASWMTPMTVTTINRICA